MADLTADAGVYANDTDRAYAVARRIRAGHFTQNGREFDLTNPFGGFKKSGVGREGGSEGMQPYVEIKTVFLPEKPAGANQPTCFKIDRSPEPVEGRHQR